MCKCCGCVVFICSLIEIHARDTPSFIEISNNPNGRKLEKPLNDKNTHILLHHRLFRLPHHLNRISCGSFTHLNSMACQHRRCTQCVEGDMETVTAQKEQLNWRCHLICLHCVHSCNLLNEISSRFYEFLLLFIIICWNNKNVNKIKF